MQPLLKKYSFAFYLLIIACILLSLGLIFSIETSVFTKAFILFTLLLSGLSILFLWKSQIQTIALRHLIEHIPNGILSFRMDDQLTILYANNALLRFREKWQPGTTANKKSALAYIDKDLLFSVLKTSNRKNFTIEYRLETSTQPVWIKAVIYRPLNRQENSVLYIFFFDTTAQKTQYQQCLHKSKQAQILRQLADDITFEYDIASDTLRHSPNYSKFFSNSPIITGFAQYLKESAYAAPDCKQNLLQSFTASLKRKGSHEKNLEIRLQTAANLYTWFSLSSKTICNQKGDPVKIIGKIVNIDKQKTVIARLQQKAYYDSLTQIYNKIMTETLINQMLMTISLLDENNAALFIIDLDDFKNINDSWGHLAGDDVLKAVAQQMHKIFPENSVLGRIGGDEFIAFCQNAGSQEDIIRKANCLSKALQTIYPHPDAPVPLSASIGIAMAPENGLTYRALVKAADEVLYSTKRNGKNFFQLADKSFTNDAIDKSIQKL